MKLITLPSLRITLFFHAFFLVFYYFNKYKQFDLHIQLPDAMEKPVPTLMNRFIDGGGEIILGDFSSRVSHGVGSARGGGGGILVPARGPGS